MNINNEISERKGLYFTDTFLISLIEVLLHEAGEHGPYTLFYLRIYLGTEMLHLYDEIKKTLDLLAGFPLKRREAACQRALFYGSCDLETLETILKESLDKLALDKSTDVEGKPLDF